MLYDTWYVHSSILNPQQRSQRDINIESSQCLPFAKIKVLSGTLVELPLSGQGRLPILGKNNMEPCHTVHLYTLLNVFCLVVYFRLGITRTHMIITG